MNLEQRVLELERIVFELRKENAQLKQRIKQLEEKLRQKSCHQGFRRPTPKNINEGKTVPLKTCPDCGSKLSKPIHRHERIIEEIIPAKTRVTRYKINHYYCKNCKQKKIPKHAEMLGAPAEVEQENRAQTQ